MSKKSNPELLKLAQKALKALPFTVEQHPSDGSKVLITSKSVKTLHKTRGDFVKTLRAWTLSETGMKHSPLMLSYRQYLPRNSYEGWKGRMFVGGAPHLKMIFAAGGYLGYDQADGNVSDE